MRAGLLARVSRLEAKRPTVQEEPYSWPMPPAEWWAELEAILREHGHCRRRCARHLGKAGG